MITCRAINTGGLGRFGNTCFSLASTIGIAVNNGQPYGFDEWIIKDNLLFGGQADRIDDYLVNPLPRIPEGLQFQDYGYHWEYRDYNIPTGNWNIQSHLQDERYFKHCIDLVRHYFRMKDEPEQNDYVAIHYRAGDYIDDPNAYHPRQTKEYYLEAMSHFPDSKFVVLSDSPEVFMRMMDGVYEIGWGNYLQDFRFMKRCHSFITANSSFSLMAAILGEHPDKKIICPLNWFGSSAGLTFGGYPEGAVII